MKLQSLLSTATLAILISNSASAQIVSGDAFLQGTYTEVGVNADGCFGSDGDAPGGYHPRGGGFGAANKLGLVVDRDRDGWATGSPAYDGDFFVPGSPVEGWKVEFDGNTFSNNRETTYGQDITGALADYVSNSSFLSVNWTGTKTGLGISQNFKVFKTQLGAVVTVTLTNTTGSAMTGVYYSRVLDPDNNQSINSDYDTTNTIEKQQPTDGLALVSATQVDGSYLAYRSTDSRAKVGQNCNTFSGTPSGYYSGTDATLTGSRSADEQICITFSFGTLAAGASVNFSFTYSLTDPMFAPATVGDVTSATADGEYGPGTTIPITITFDQSVTVTGTPTLALNSGGSASYASGSPGTTLTFNYLVASGQTSADLDYSAISSLALNGGTVQNTTGGLDADLTLPLPGTTGSLGANKALVIAEGDETPTPGEEVAPLDFDGDGVTDITSSHFRKKSGRLILSWLTSEDESLHEKSFKCADCSSVPADYTGDGVTEAAFIFRRPEDKKLRWEIYNANGSLLKKLTFGRNADIAIAGCNFNATAEQDLAFLRRGTLHVRNLNEDSVTQPGLRINTATEEFVGCGDITGDSIDEAFIRGPKDRLVVYTVAGTKLFQVNSKKFSQAIALDVDNDDNNEVGTVRKRDGRDSVLEFYSSTAPNALVATYELGRDAKLLNGRFRSTQHITVPIYPIKDGVAYQSGNETRQRLLSDDASTVVTVPDNIRKLHAPVVVHK